MYLAVLLFQNDSCRKDHYTRNYNLSERIFFIGSLLFRSAPQQPSHSLTSRGVGFIQGDWRLESGLGISAGNQRYN